MARTVNEQEFAAKRNEILDAAQGFVFSKGYGQMTLQDILGVIGMSNGAFYHYFDSKPAVLEALIERMLQEAEQPLHPIVHDPHLPALEKLRRFFATLNRLRTVDEAFLLDLLRVWYTDDNAIVRQKVEPATIERRAALMTVIIRQGIHEGVFTTLHPDQAGEVVVTLVHGMDNSIARLMLSFEQERDRQRIVEGIVATHDTYTDALERVLGAPSESLYRVNADTVKVWVAALRVNP